MKNNKIISIIFAVFAFAVIAMLPGSASAQVQGRYANVYSKSQVKGYIDKLETSSNRFRNDFDRFMDRSNLNGTRTEDEYNGYVEDYENSLDRLRNQFNRRRNWWDNRSNAEEMLNRAQPVNTMMNAIPFARNLERQWRTMRNDINKVADTYDLPGLEGGGWNGGNNNGGGWSGGNNGGGWNGGGGATSTPPSWAQGSFTWNVTDQRQMIIDRSGRVTIYALGKESYGTFNRNVININGDSLTVSRVSNGVRLTSQTSGGTSDWYK